MGANTIYYVTVLKAHEEKIEVSALHDEGAIEEAMKEPGVIRVLDVKHWSLGEKEKGE